MGNQHPRHPAIPKYKTYMLEGVAAELSRRAKAIKYQTLSFSCTQSETDEQEERLDIRIETYGIVDGRPIRIQCSIWSNGDLWISIVQNKPSKIGGAETLYAGSGNLAGVESTAVAEMIEQLRADAYALAKNEVPAEYLEQRWLIAGLTSDTSQN